MEIQTLYPVQKIVFVHVKNDEFIKTENKIFMPFPSDQIEPVINQLIELLRNYTNSIITESGMLNIADENSQKANLKSKQQAYCIERADEITIIQMRFTTHLIRGINESAKSLLKQKKQYIQSCHLKKETPKNVKLLILSLDWLSESTYGFNESFEQSIFNPIPFNDEVLYSLVLTPSDIEQLASKMAGFDIEAFRLVTEQVKAFKINKMQ